MGQNGGAALVMYPYITLIPVAIFYSFIPFTIGSFYFILFSVTLCSLLISYYASLGISNSYRFSFMFSILYSTSSMFMNYWFNNGDVGVILVITFLPLVFFGYLKFINDGSWIEMTTGFVLVTYSHVLSPIIIALFLAFLSLFYLYKFKNMTLIINGVKFIVMTLMLSSIVWMPAYFLLRSNHNITAAFSYSNMNGTDLLSTTINGLKASVNFTPNFTPSFFAVLSIFIVPIFFYKKMGRDMRRLSIATLLFYVFTTNLIPWTSLSSSPIAFIQFPWRLDFMPQLVLIYLFVYCINNLIFRISIKNFKLLYRSIIVLAMLLQFYTQYEVIEMQKQEPILNTTMVKNGSQQYHLSNGLIAYRITDNSQVNNFIKARNAFYDYYPNSIGNNGYLLSNDTGTYVDDKNHSKQLQFQTLGNGKFKFHNNQNESIKQLNIPFIIYNDVNYNVTLDGKKIPYVNTSEQIMAIQNVQPGNHVIQVDVEKSNITKFSYLVFLIGIIFYMLFILDKNKKIEHYLFKKLH